MAEIKISELEPTTDLEGLYTIGSDKNNLSKKVSLQFLREAADYAIEQGDYAKQEGSTIESRITDFKAETDAKLTELESETARLSNYVISSTYVRVIDEQIQPLGIQLIAGVTYTISEVSDIPIGHNLYIKDSSSFVRMNSGATKNFTPPISGELYIYIPTFPSSSMYNCTIMIKSVVESKIEEYVENHSIGISNNKTINSIIKELYIANAIDLSQVDEIEIYNNYLLSNGNYATLIRLKQNSSTILDMGKAYSTKQELENGLYKYGENYAIIDWGLAPDYLTISGISLNVDRCNNLDFSPSIARVLNPIENTSSNLGRNGVGFAQKENVDDCDYCYFPVYGQSFTYANDGGYKLTDSFDDDCYMVGDSSFSWELAQIKNLTTDDNVEYTHTDAINLISKLWKKYAHKKQKFIVGSYGMGDKTILELSQNNGLSEHSWFEDRFLAGLSIAKQAVEKENKTFNCPCILFMQGESDYGQSYVNGCKGDKDLYKERFLALKVQMQNAVMNVTGQSEPPSVMVYVVGGEAFNDYYEGISQAVCELSKEHNDVISIGSYYQCPDFYYHLTPDGRRWLAEIIAKVYYEHFIIGIDNTLTIDSVEYKEVSNSVLVKTKNAVLPLQIDTYIMPEKSNYGFNVFTEKAESISMASDGGVIEPTGIFVKAGQTYQVSVKGTGKTNIFVIDNADSSTIYRLSETDGVKLFTPIKDGEIGMFMNSAFDLSLIVKSIELFPLDVKLNGNTIELRLSKKPNSHFWVTYGNRNANGGGNVKDSDTWVSYYLYESNSQGTSENALTYTPLWVDGSSMIGHHYDMSKWLPNFGVKITL